MNKTAELILTDSYYNVFSVLKDRLCGKVSGIDDKNVVFSEEKVSLMAERVICETFGGSFNTDVYSFSNYLKKKKDVNPLSKEGSAMAVKKILSFLDLECFNRSRAGLAPSLFELIAQLKSASVSPEDLENCIEDLEGVRKNKIKDVVKVYRAYEEFIKKEGFDDQSSALSYLPQVIENDADIRGAEVYLIGYNSWTAQAREIVYSLLVSAKKVTAILTSGENEFLYLGETAKDFRRLCKRAGIELKEEFLSSFDKKECAVTSRNLFNPYSFKKEKFETEDVYLLKAENPAKEIETIAGAIKSKVMSGARYRDFTVAVPDVKIYEEDIKRYFGEFSVPFFLDEKINPECHPLVKLIYAYFDLYRKNFERKTVTEFFKNPLFSKDREFADYMEKYLIRYNINFGKIKEPFTLGFKTQEEKTRAEDFRKKICAFLCGFDLKDMLLKLGVKEKTERFTALLIKRGENVKAAVNGQIYDAVTGLIDDMERILKGADVSLNELKSVFKSGVLAMELSVIPQFCDAVFIGGYKETALANSPYLFAVGLTGDVPFAKADVALFNDGDLESLKNRINVEPTIKIVNARERENVGVALCSFGKKLVLSYPLSDFSGKETVKSEVISFAERAFTLKPFYFSAKYLTERSALNDFAKDCGEFAYGNLNDFSAAATYYGVSGSPVKDEILNCANAEVKIRLEDVKQDLFDSSSPTKIEDYFRCPYKAFVERVLRVKTDEGGDFSSLTVGNFMHGVFELYFKRMGEIDGREKSDAVFKEAAEEILKDPEYERFLADAITRIRLERVLKESENYCYNCYLSFKNSEFAVAESEKKVEFTLPKTKVRLNGKIDRVDKFGNYLRIIDYKTGGKTLELKELYAGKQLQLYLYAAAAKGREDKIAGLYYAGVEEKYRRAGEKKGKTLSGLSLDSEEVLFAQDKNLKTEGKSDLIDACFNKNGVKNAVKEAEIEACVNYAVALCDKAVEEMKSGVIIASPYEKTCDYCPFKGMCEKSDGIYRKVAGVGIADISEIAAGEKE